MLAPQDVGRDHGVAEQALVGGPGDRESTPDHGGCHHAGQADVEHDVASDKGGVAVAGDQLPQGVDDGAG